MSACTLDNYIPVVISVQKFKNAVSFRSVSKLWVVEVGPVESLVRSHIKTAAYSVIFNFKHLTACCRVLAKDLLKKEKNGSLL